MVPAGDRCLLLLSGAWGRRLVERRKAAAGLVQTIAAYNLAGFEPRPNQPWHDSHAQMQMTPTQETEPSSWVGGLPALPKGMPWPEIDGTPAVFRAQIDCRQLPDDLWGGMAPPSGWLIFFSGADSLGDVVVRYTQQLGPLRGTASAPRWALIPADPATQPEGSEYRLRSDTPRQALLQHDTPPLVLSPHDDTSRAMYLTALQTALENRAHRAQEPDSPETVSAEDLAHWVELAQTSTPDQVDAVLDRIAQQDHPVLAKHLRRAVTIGYLAQLERHARCIHAQAPDDLPDTVRTALEPIWQFEADRDRLTLGGPVDLGFFYDRMKDPVCLLQIPSSSLLAWEFAGNERWGVFIPPQALQARDFSQAWGSVSN